ncbi:MAG: lysophospholipid acyltransferase family protein [Kiritimatiellae bacterium]|nr:lysophospholipid acyltransferase family protein [Kiritimatiellia bacterium]
MTFLQRHAYGIGCAIGALLWPFFASRRRLSVENILKGGVAGNAEEAKKIAKAAWCHLPGHICEALCVPKVVTSENWREHLDTSGGDPETVKLLLDTPQTPILLVSSHHGVWEAATNLLSFARPMIAIARTMNNRFVANWMKKHHFRGDVTVIDKNRGFTPQIIKRWLRENAAMTILMDQHSGKGLPLKFFGRSAKTFTTAARLAMRYGVPIVAGSFVRIAPYRYRLVGGGILRFSKNDDLAKCTQLLNDRLEEAIREYPAQYLWSHRRWRKM